MKYRYRPRPVRAKQWTAESEITQLIDWAVEQTSDPFLADAFDYDPEMAGMTDPETKEGWGYFTYFDDHLGNVQIAPRSWVVVDSADVVSIWEDEHFLMTFEKAE